MFDRIIDSVKSAPEQLKAAPETLKSIPGRLNARGEKLATKARQRVALAVADSNDTIHCVRTGALERAEAVLAAAPEVPVVGTIADKAEALVSSRLEALTAVETEGYAGLNAREAIKAIKGTESRTELLNIRRFEAANKARKTVLAAIEQALGKLTEVEPVAFGFAV